MESLGWNERAGQQIRLKILLGIGDLTAHSVLDAGCGHGDLFEYLIERFPQPEILWRRMMPGILQVALDRYSHHPGASFF